ncbi:sugar porter family MFS transporter [Neopusillimonas maritima]|uniref:sugar porter family MFS transporter n=1 Tax=Neopusillimonas maritima TaxID=2026239 RepID=UPI001C558550|nr:sugar porter family MFS transporter [Neopusillimonas maritima]
MRGLDPSYRVAALVCCFGILFGFGITSIAGVLERLAVIFQLDTSAQETLVSTLVIACFAGAMLAAPLSSRWGRRPVMYLAFALTLAGYAVILSEPAYGVLIAARLALGISIGLSSMVVPMYAAEATPARKRGAVVALFQLAITAGILLSYTVALLFVSSWSWFYIMGVGIIPGILGVWVLINLPESPRWLSAKSRLEDAGNAARALSLQQEWHEAARQEESLDANTHVPSAAHPATPTKKSRTSIVAVLVLCSTLFILQNFSGIDAILYYAPHLFQTLGFAPGTASLAATFGLGLANFLATIVALKLVDNAGRRPLLIFGSALMTVGLALVILASLYAMPYIGLIGLCLFIVAFAISLGPLPYVMMSELFPSAIRENGIAVASSISWLFNATIAFTFLSVINTIGLSATIGIFMVVCLMSLIISIIYLPETRRVRLEDIETKVMQGEKLRNLGLPRGTGPNT